MQEQTLREDILPRQPLAKPLSSVNSVSDSTRKLVRKAVAELHGDEDAILKEIHDREEQQLSGIFKERGLNIPMDKAIQHYQDFVFIEAKERECASCTHDDPKKVFSCHKLCYAYDEATGELHFSATLCPYAATLKKQMAYNKALNGMSIAKRFQSRTFENFTVSDITKNIYDFALQWAHTFQPTGKGLYIFGQFGSGKTHLAVAALIEVQRMFGIAGAFLVFPDYLAQLQRWFDDHEKMEEYFAFYAKAPLLVIDDIGGGRKKESMMSSWANEQLYRLINYRYESELPTIVTTTVSPIDLSYILMPEITSRLAEMCYFLHDRAGDYRMQKQNIQYIE